MSKFTVPLVMVAAVSVAGAAWQTHQLSSERTQAAALSRSAAELEKRKADLEKELAGLREQNAIYQSESEQLRAKLAGKGGAPASSVTQVHDASADIVPVAEGGQKKAEKQNFMQSMARMMKDPEMKKAMRSQQMIGMQITYGDLPKELGLDPEQSATLMELLADRQIAISEKSMEMMSGAKGDADKMAEMGKAINDLQNEHNEQIAAALGDEKYQKFKDYEGSIGERFALNQVQQQFAAKGMPLGDSERQSLLAIMSEERRNAPPGSWGNAGSNAGEQMKAMQSEEAIARMMEQQKATNRRILDRASAFLTPDQLNQLGESQEQFLRMQEMGMKMGRQMLQGE